MQPGKLYLRIFLLAAIVFQITSCTEKESIEKEEWQPLFNGKDHSGWTIKIAGEKLNENYKNTFRVEDSMLRIMYDQYDKFDGKFGHIYSNMAFTHYKLRFQYRFIGRGLPDAPVWADRNSGIMLHSQSAQSMEISQEFPVSLEMQLLADTGRNDRTTGNICTPGTRIYLSNSLRPEHCINSNSKSYPVNVWVNAIIEVYGDSLIRHIIEKDTVLTYTKPTIGGGFITPEQSWASTNIMDSTIWINRANTPSTEGYIALQAESSAVDFRRLEILSLAGCMDPKAKNYKSYYTKADNNKCQY